jgi:hypothetical protein
MTDDGLTFRASIRAADGTEVYRETPHRAELLEWVRAHTAAGGLLIAVGMDATGQAVPAMLLALAFGEANRQGAGGRVL